jgi:hypothetical protein
MHTQETMNAEKIRRKPLPNILGICPDCGQPVLGGQEFLRTDCGVQHALCFYEPAYAKRMRDLKPKTGQ